jgi:hypothetical protein
MASRLSTKQWLRSRCWVTFAAIGFLSTSMLIAGCGVSAEDAETIALRSKYLVATEPSEPLSLTKAAALVGIGTETKESEKVADASSENPNATAENIAGEPPATNIEQPSEGVSPQVSEVADITIVGRIYAGQLEPWEDGKASFMLSELPEDGHGEGHDSDNCPFCKRRLAKAPTAIVKFVDAQGQTLPIDSRKLFGLEKEQAVVVHGTVIAGEFNSIVLVADQLHIRKR